MLVVDALRFLIEVQSPTGQLLGTIGEIGDGPGALARPRGIAVDSEGHVYVADAAFDNVQIFDLTGRLCCTGVGPAVRTASSTSPRVCSWMVRTVSMWPTATITGSRFLPISARQRRTGKTVSVVRNLHNFKRPYRFPQEVS